MIIVKHCVSVVWEWASQRIPKSHRRLVAAHGLHLCPAPLAPPNLLLLMALSGYAWLLQRTDSLSVTLSWWDRYTAEPVGKKRPLLLSDFESLSREPYSIIV